MQSELQMSLERWSSRLGFPLAIFDEHDRLVVHSAHVGDIDDVRRQSILSRSPIEAIRSLIPDLRLNERSGPIRVPLPAGLEMQPRMVVPMHYAGTYFGSVWLRDPGGSFGDEHSEQLEKAADELATLMHDEQLSSSRALGLSGQRRAGRRLRDLLMAPDSRRVDAWQRLGEAIGRSGGVNLAILATRAPTAADASELLRHLGRQEVAQPLLALEKPGWAVWGVLASPPSIEGAITHVVQGLRGAERAEDSLVIGISDAIPWGGKVTTAIRNAELALEVAELLPEFKHVAYWQRLGVVGLAALLERQQPGHWQEYEAMNEFLETSDDQTLRTVESFLDHAGDVQLTAVQMCLHRATVYYRLNKAESLMKTSLRDGNMRTLLHVALKSRRLSRARYDKAQSGKGSVDQT